MMILQNIKRIWFDLVLGGILTFYFLSGSYENFPAPIQLITLKAILVSLGFIHAHCIGKICFPKVDWDSFEWNPKHLLRIVLYAVFIYAYSQGG